MPRKRKPPAATGRTATELIDWVLEHFPAVQAMAERGEPLDQYQFPTDSAKTTMLSVLMDPQKGLAKLLQLKASAEGRQTAKKSRPMADDARRQFDILDRLTKTASSHASPPGGPDFGNDPELVEPISP